jgi:tetratricopeptide (TPR) repeat protein
MIVLLLTLSASAGFASPRAEVKQGNEAAQRGLNDAALLHYMKALEMQGDTSVILYDLGNLKYEQGDYENSQKLFQGAFDEKDSKVEQSQTLYNLGNSYFQAKQYDKAAQAYIESVKRNPKDAEARYNLELALRQMRQQQQQQQQQDQNKEESKEQDKNQDQKNDQDQQKQQPDSSQQQQQQQADQNEQSQDSTQQQPPKSAQEQQMSEEDAERLLNALLQDEQNALDKVNKAKIQGRGKREKDW